MRRFAWACVLPLWACSSEGDAGGSSGEPGEASGGSMSIAEGAGGGQGGTGGAVATGGLSSGGSIMEPPSTSGGASATGGASSTGGQSATGGNTGSGGGETSDGCPFEGRVSYSLNDPGAWPDGIEELITAAMDEAVYYYNCYADLEKNITVNYNPGVPTAEANVDGWLSFGANTSYMQTATAMHEVSHTLGVGYYPWTELMDQGRWVGMAVDDLMQSLPAEERDADEYSQRTYITGDSQHFWPYGLNQAAEYQSEWSLINHVRIVAAMQVDKQSFLGGN